MNISLCARRLVLLALAGTALAGAGPTTPSPDPRDLQGVWFGIGNQDPGNMRYVPQEGGEPPFTPAGLAVYRQRQDAADAGNPIRQLADDCMPHGVPAAIRLPTPLQIIQTPGQTTIIQEASRTVRIIFMDEAQPAAPTPTFIGHSVGKWDGDTLVVDTIGLRPNWLDPTGAPASEQMHLVERIRKIGDGKQIEDVFTITDPKYYTRSWTARRVYDWHPEERVQEYVCEESQRHEPTGGQP